MTKLKKPAKTTATKKSKSTSVTTKLKAAQQKLAQFKKSSKDAIAKLRNDFKTKLTAVEKAAFDKGYAAAAAIQAKKDAKKAKALATIDKEFAKLAPKPKKAKSVAKKSTKKATTKKVAAKKVKPATKKATAKKVKSATQKATTKKVAKPTA